MSKRSPVTMSTRLAIWSSHDRSVLSWPEIAESRRKLKTKVTKIVLFKILTKGFASFEIDVIHFRVYVTPLRAAMAKFPCANATELIFGISYVVLTTALDFLKLADLDSELLNLTLNALDAGGRLVVRSHR